ncbi:lysoplasmalogenase [Altererythrobacter aerius]|uniref:Lysoplasmalogenase n=1 Tax=Tsuneonella aeria TaxID=1837929 RepID=A0A6I4TCZ2_9SPHN|nr:lysoplasmalogenase family protein [Tsuneonella aeria]MXO74075.1 lysoplasmalogenase [Tsuneonella aeria]
MAKRALIDHRLWLLAGMAMAIAFWTMDGSAGIPALRVALKGGSVAVLAIYAWLRGRTGDATMIGIVMAIGAAGDVGMELNVIAGGALFAASHIVAIALYRRNRRPAPTGSQIAAAGALLLGVPLGAWALTHDPMPVIYAVVLGAMAGAAWLSRFSRYTVGIGALLFVASDMFIFARLGGVLDESVTSWLVWPLYYGAQLMICTGVVRASSPNHRG